jgi:type II secretion system protein J
MTVKRQVNGKSQAAPLAGRAGRAFTLIELLLAVGVMAIVLVAINAVFFGALHLRATVTNALDEALPLEQALTFVRRDLQNTLAPGGQLSVGLQSGVVNGNVSQNNGITLYTTTGLLSSNQPWGDIQKVSYQLQDPENIGQARGKDLIRSVTRNLLPTATEEAHDQWLMGNVQQLDFSYYDGANWQDTWDTTSTQTNLPYAVKVRLQLAANRSSGPLPKPIEMIVPLITQTRTNAASSTTTSGG